MLDMSNSNIHWPREDTIQLIELFKEHECLRNVRSDTYRNRGRRATALKEIADKISSKVKVSPSNVKKRKKLTASETNIAGK